MAQTVTDQHESGIAVRRGTHHTGTAAELPAEPLNDIIGPDVDPVLKEKIAVGQGFLNSILHLLGSLFQLHCPQLRDHGFRFLMGGLLVFLSMDRLEHFGHQLHLGTWGKRTHCGKSGRYTADIWARGTLLPRLSCQGTCLQPPALLHPSRDHAATGRSQSSWPCPLSYLRQRLKPCGIRPHLPLSPPEWPHSQDLRPSYGSDRFHPHRRRDSVRLARGGYANLQCGHTLFRFVWFPP